MSSQYYFNSNESRSFYPAAQHYQSTANFNRNSPAQAYAQSPTPQVRACVRVLGSQDQYPLTSSPHLVQISPQQQQQHFQLDAGRSSSPRVVQGTPQQQHFLVDTRQQAGRPSSPRVLQVSPQQHHLQFDSRQQAGRPSGPAVVYQTPGAAQFTHHNVDLWTEGPSTPRQDHYVQAQRVSVRPVSTGSPQQSHSVSPQRHQDHLQQYYNQLTPEQHQQLLRQQQLQQNSFEQRTVTQQVAPSTAAYNGGQGQARQPEQYYASQQEEPPQVVGIRNLMNRFDSPGPRQQAQPRSRSTSSRHYSTSNYTSHAGSNQSSTRSYTTNSMTYSALPKPQEPPVNSLEYYQLLQQGGIPFNNLQQAVAPAHIQHAPPSGLGSLRDRFKTGSFSEEYSRAAAPPPSRPAQQYAPAQVSGGAGASLSSIRNQYMSRAKDALQNELPPQAAPSIPRTILGEDYPPPKPAHQLQQQQQQQEPPGATDNEPQAVPNENPEQAAPADESGNVEEGVSSF